MLQRGLGKLKQDQARVSEETHLSQGRLILFHRQDHASYAGSIRPPRKDDF